MLKHLLPAWLPLLLLITFLGCQSFETKKIPSNIVNTDIPVIKSCPDKTKKIFSNSDLVICGKILLNTSDNKVIKDLRILQKVEKRQYKLAFMAKDFQLFQWSHSKKNNLQEVMPIFLNERYKLLSVNAYQLDCSLVNCLIRLDTCETAKQENLFPMISYRVKYHVNKNTDENRQMITQESILQQLVWQSVNGDLRARSILINYNDWLTVQPHMLPRFNHFKKIVEKKSNSMCIKKHNIFVNNY